MAKILYIDDIFQIESTARSYEAMVRAVNHTLLTAENGKKGLEIIAREPVDLIFLDLVMPVMNGADVLMKLKKIDSRLPVVMCTSDPYDAKICVNDIGYEHVIGYCDCLDNNKLLKYLDQIKLQ